MQWEGRRESSNVEDRRGRGGLPIIGGGLGVVLLLAISLLTGTDPRKLLQRTGEGSAEVGLDSSGRGGGSGNDRASRFISVVLADTEDVWNQQFAAMGSEYVEPKLVMFTEQVRSACGGATAAVGPFYCPEDQKVYLDLGFFEQLQRQLGAPGDFAQAYVVAHEVGHHVQKLLGISDRVEKLRGRVSQREYNELSMRLELQADFLAGVWAHHTQQAKHVLEPGDLEEALRAASAVGDDNIQKQSRGYAVPDSFTHGTSEQRVRWFRRGFETGDIRQGDTFSVPEARL